MQVTSVIMSMVLLLQKCVQGSFSFLPDVTVEGDVCECSFIYVFPKCLNPPSCSLGPDETSITRCTEETCPPCRKYSMTLIPGQLIVTAFDYNEMGTCDNSTFLPDLLDCGSFESTATAICPAKFFDSFGVVEFPPDGHLHGPRFHEALGKDGALNEFHVPHNANSEDITTSSPTVQEPVEGGDSDTNHHSTEVEDDSGVSTTIMLIAIFGSIGGAIAIAGVAYYVYEFKQYKKYLNDGGSTFENNQEAGYVEAL